MALVGENWFQYDDRVWRTPGIVVDLGCLHWDWCQPFLGKIPVVGVDPLEEDCPKGASLIKAVVTPFPGTCRMHGASLGASLYPADGTGCSVMAITWHELVAAHSPHGPPNLVKMNIEGAELPLLISVAHPMADQVVVAFHDWLAGPGTPPKEATAAVLSYLGSFYSITETFHKFRWFVLLRK